MFDLDTIIQSTNLFLVVKDINLKYIYCSDGVAQLLNLDSPKNIIGKTDFDFHSQHLAQKYHSDDLKVFKNDKALKTRELHPKNNESIEILTTKHLLKNQTGKTTGIVVSFIEMTEIIEQPIVTQTMPTSIQFNEYTKHTFTRREKDVLNHVMMGSTAKQIAKILSLSPRTVEDYIQNIKQKLQCDHKHDVVKAAISMGIRFP